MKCAATPFGLCLEVAEGSIPCYDVCAALAKADAAAVVDDDLDDDVDDDVNETSQGGVDPPP